MGNLKILLDEAEKLGINELNMYCTSLDFFQQALGTGDLSKLEEMLYCIRDLQRESGITLGLRALTRADSYMEAVDKTNSLIINLARDAGFYQFGFGADGAANVALLKAMRKGAYELGSRLIKAFELTFRIILAFRVVREGVAKFSQRLESVFSEEKDDAKNDTKHRVSKTQLGFYVVMLERW